MPENKVQELEQLFHTKKPIIGMVHLPPLPGAPVYNGEGLDSVIEYALEEARKLIDGGVNGIQVENYGDHSYFVNNAAKETISAISIVAHELRRKYREIPMGICLLADPAACIAVAHCAKAQFIRATVFTEGAVDVGGLALRSPHAILRYRKFLDPSIKIFADVHIKHSAPLGPRPIEESAYDAAYFLADAVIISGKHTGKETSLEDVRKVKTCLPDFPVLIGSGLNENNAAALFQYADGSFVGTNFKEGGDSFGRISEDRVSRFMSEIKKLRS